MKWLKRLVILLLLVVIGFLGWSWQFGPMRMKRDISEFAKNMESCTPFSQDYNAGFGGYIMNRAVLGPVDETCGVTMDTLSPQVIQCAFAKADMTELAAAFARQADNIGLFGIKSLTIDTQSTDPLQQAMNSPACKLIEG